MHHSYSSPSAYLADPKYFLVYMSAACDASTHFKLALNDTCTSTGILGMIHAPSRWALRNVEVAQISGVQFIDPTVYPDRLSLWSAFRPCIDDGVRLSKFKHLTSDILVHNNRRGFVLGN